MKHAGASTSAPGVRRTHSALLLTQAGVLKGHSGFSQGLVNLLSKVFLGEVGATYHLLACDYVYVIN